MKKVDASCYLHPRVASGDSDGTSENRTSIRPKHDPTYSALLGWGFSGPPKLLPPDSQTEDESR